MKYFYIFLFFFYLFFSFCNEGNSRNEKEQATLEMLVQMKKDQGIDLSVAVVSPNNMGVKPKEAWKCLDMKGVSCKFYLLEGVIKDVVVSSYSYDNLIKLVLTEKELRLDTMTYFKRILCDSLQKKVENIFHIVPGIIMDTVEITEHNYAWIRGQFLSSILESCKYNTFLDLPDELKYKLFLEYQHSSPEIMANYFYLIKDAYENNLIPGEFYALATDRILCFNGFKQVYGTQIFNGVWHPVENYSRMDSLRHLFDMEPIDLYLERFGIKRW